MPPRALLEGEGLATTPVGSLLEALERRADDPRPWLTFHHGPTPEAVSAAQVLERAWAFSADLADAAGQNVGVWQPNCVDFVAAFFGAMGAGATAVPLPWPVLDGHTAEALTAMAPVVKAAHLQTIAAPEGARVEGASLRWARPRPGARGFTHRPGGETPAFVQFTSGSTQTPRGAVISHRAALFNAHALVQGLGLHPDDVGVSWLPLFHDMGLIGVLLSSLVGGFAVHVLRPARFLLHPWSWLELVGQERATLTVGPDFGYSLVARRAGGRPFELSSLRLALSGSEPIHLSTLEAFGARFEDSGFCSDAFIGAYGLAENTLGVSLGPALSRLHRSSSGRLLPSVGRPLPGVQVAIDGPSGEVCVRSPSLMSGYFEDPAATSRALADGWLRTGDLGVVDAGQLFITGRDKELVIKAGRKFHPGDIEQLVAAAVDTPPNGVAVFNDAEQLVLVIEQRRASATTDDAAVRATIADHLGVRVDRVQWVPAGSLPRTTSGKLQRGACALKFGARA